MSEPFKAGDKVYIDSLHNISKATITRVTKTQAIIDHGNYEQRFKLDTGRMLGGNGYDSTYIRHPDERLDREWRNRQADAARRTLAYHADRDDAAAIRAAFEKWDRLEKEVEHD